MYKSSSRMSQYVLIRKRHKLSAIAQRRSLSLASITCFFPLVFCDADFFAWCSLAISGFLNCAGVCSHGCEFQMNWRTTHGIDWEDWTWQHHIVDLSNFIALEKTRFMSK